MIRGDALFQYQEKASPLQPVSAPVTIGDSWLAIYPDSARRRKAWFQQSYLVEPLLTLLHARFQQAIYPDQVRGRRGRVPPPAGVVNPLLPIAPITLPGTPEAIYQDWIRWRKRWPLELDYHVTPLFSLAAPASAQFPQAFYPDTVQQPKRIQDPLVPITPLLPIVPATTHAWQSVFPDRTRRRREWAFIPPAVFEPYVPLVPFTCTTFGSPFLFTRANWDAGVEFFFEVYFRASAGTVKAQLLNLTTGQEVAGSELLTSSSSFVRMRSGALALADGSLYVAQFCVNVGGVVQFRMAKVIGI